MKEIVQDGATVLRKVAKPVPEELFGSSELVRLIADMTQALDKEPEGVALAAPQVGVLYRLFIVRKDRTVPLPEVAEDKALPVPEPEIEIYINPEVVKTSHKKAEGEEGCLSIRGVYGVTKRHERVTIRACRLDGSRFTRGAGGLMAQIFEHEIDHLNGALFTDHVERLFHIAPEPEMRKFAFFGTPKVASDTLSTLMAHGFTPAVVVTSPDAPRGRGLALAPSETKTFALAHGISVLTPRILDAEAISAIRDGCDYAIVVAYGKIFPATLIAAFPAGVINVHYSLLPKYRGATPLESALLAGDSTTGVTVQKMSLEVDAGAILAQEATAIAQNETARELRPRLVALGAQLLVGTLPAYLRGDIAPISQDVSLATRAHKIKKEDGLLELNAHAETNWNKYRAYADSIGTYFFDNGKRMKITKACLKNGKFIIERVIPEGKREMDYEASR